MNQALHQLRRLVPHVPNWLAAFSSVASLVLLVGGVLRVETFIQKVEAKMGALEEANQAQAAPLRLVFRWDAPDGTQQLETTRERGETFPQLWERHKLYIRLAQED